MEENAEQSGPKPPIRKKEFLRGWAALEPDVMICSGTISQAHKKLKGQNEQGAPICVIACAFASLKKTPTWSPKTLDQIIEVGSNLWAKSRQMLENKCVPHLKPTLVYKYFFLADVKVSMKVGAGAKRVRIVRRGQFGGASQLEEHLGKFFQNHDTGIAAFDTVYFAVWKQERFYFIFDPLEHDSRGDKWEGPPQQGVCYAKRFVEIRSLAENILKNVDYARVRHFILYPCSVEKLVKINRKPPETLDGSPPLPAEKLKKRQPPPKLEEPPVATPKPEGPTGSTEATPEEASLEEAPTEGVIAVEVQPKLSKSQIPPEKPKLKSVTNFKEFVEGKSGILRACTHQNDPNFSKYKGAQSYPNALAALTMLRLLKSKHWIRTTLHDILRLAEVIHHDTLKLPPDEDIKIITVDNRKFTPVPQEDIGAMGHLTSTEDNILNLEQALRNYFLDFDCGIIFTRPVIAVWKEDDRYYMWDPNERDGAGRPVKDQAGVACVTWHVDLKDLVATYMSNVALQNQKDPFVILRVVIEDYVPTAEDWFSFKALTLTKWILRGTFSQKDRRFPPETRNVQCTASAIIALAYKELLEEKNWDPATVDQVLLNGNEFYSECVEFLQGQNRYRSSHLLVGEIKRTFDMENKRINLEIDDCLVNGILNAKSGSGVPNLKRGFEEFFGESDAGIVTANDQSMAVWRRADAFFYFDSHSRDENGVACTHGTACLLRLGTVDDLTDMLLTNFGASRENLFNVSRIVVRLIDITDDGFVKPPLVNFEAIDDYVAILRSNLSERHKKFGLNAGKQTVPMCLAALAMNILSPSFHWKKEDVDQVLVFGDKLYFKSMEENYSRELPEEFNVDAITTDNVRNEIRIGSNLFRMEFEDYSRGNLEDDLKEALQSLHVALQEEGNRIFQTVLESPYMTVSMWRDDNLFYLFDPKARDGKGQIYGKDDWSAKVVIAAPAEADDASEVEEFEGEGDHDDEYGGGDNLGPGEEFEEEDREVVQQDTRYEPQLEPAGTDTGGGAGEGARLGGSAEEGEVGEEEAAPPREKKGSAFWRMMEEEGKACVLRFSRLDDLCSHLIDNSPPNQREDIEYRLRRVSIVNTPVLHEVFDPETEEKEDEFAGDWNAFKELDKGRWILRGRKNMTDGLFPECNRGKQEVAVCVVALASAFSYAMSLFKDVTVDMVLAYGDKFYTLVRRLRMKGLKKDKKLKLSDEEVEELLKMAEFTITDYPPNFCMGDKLIAWEASLGVVSGDVTSKVPEEVLDLATGLSTFFAEHTFGILQCMDYNVSVWRDQGVFYMFDPHPTGPGGVKSPVGVASVTRFRNLEDLADVYVKNLPKIGNHFFTIHALIFGQGRCPRQRQPEEEEMKATLLGGFGQIMAGKHILRSTKIFDCNCFNRGVHIQSASIAFAALAFTLCHEPRNWTRMFADEILTVGDELYVDSLKKLGDRFNPWTDVLNITRVNTDFRIGRFKANCAVRQTEQNGIVDIKNDPKIPNLRQGLERFFEEHSHGILLVHRLVLAVWEEEEQGEAFIYMFDPNSRGATGLPTHGGTACAVKFRNAKMAAEHVIACLLEVDKRSTPFIVVPVEVVVGFMRSKRKKPRKGALLRSPLVTSTPVTCPTKRRIMEEKKLLKQIVEKERQEKALKKLKLMGRQKLLVLNDNEAIVRGQRYVEEGREVPVNFAAFVLMQLFGDFDKWTWQNIELILEVGNQLYIDSVVAYHLNAPLLTIENTLRRFIFMNIEFKLKVLEPMVYSDFTEENVLRVLEAAFVITNFCLINYKDFVVTVHFKSGLYYLFDPFGRDYRGVKAVKNGSAMLMRFKQLDLLVQRLVYNLNDPQIEESLYAILFLELESAEKLATS